MPNVKIKVLTDLREQPSAGSTSKDTLFPNQVVTATGNASPDGLWLEIDLVPGGARRGWVQKAETEPVDGLEFAPSAFVQMAFFLQRRFNQNDALAPFFVGADFVIARAVVETGLEKAEQRIAGSDAIGPLQVSSAEWQAFIGSPGGLAEGLMAADRDHPIRQIGAALYRMHSDQKAISTIQRGKQPPVGTETDPFQPSLLDVFHAHLTSSPAAAVAILDASTSEQNRAKPIDQVLRAPQGPLSEAQIAALFNVRGKYAGTTAQPKSVSDFVAATESELTDALARAFELTKLHAPEELTVVREAEAPWLDVAKQAEADHIDEDNPAHTNIILDYFASTNLGRQNRILPWCGAFAAHCMTNSGLAKTIPNGAAAAVNWKKWGDELPIKPGEVPEGAVVVLAPSEGTGTTGHVGFFTQFLDDNKKVELLGGNQSDKVIRRAFLTSRIAAIRWVETAPTAAEELLKQAKELSAKGEELKPSDIPISQRALDLLIEFEVSGQKAYERKYRNPVWPGGASGATIGIGYDVGHQSAKQLRTDCEGIIPAGMITALEQACGVTGSAAKALTQGLKPNVDIPWEQAMALFKAKGIPRWVGLVQKALGPNTNRLSPDSLGALVSLTYNRGASFSKAGDRFAEMRAIKQHVQNQEFAKIPGELRSMKRLWPGVRGLQDRRDREAELFQRGLA